MSSDTRNSSTSHNGLARKQALADDCRRFVLDLEKFRVNDSNQPEVGVEWQLPNVSKWSTTFTPLVEIAVISQTVGQTRLQVSGKYSEFLLTRYCCQAGPSFAPFMTANFPASQRKSVLNRHLYALSDNRQQVAASVSLSH